MACGHAAFAEAAVGRDCDAIADGASGSVDVEVFVLLRYDAGLGTNLTKA